MREFAFISRHEPTAEQHALAKAQEIALSWIGDHDAFSVLPGDVTADFEGFVGVVVVHPAAAMRLHNWFDVGVFRNTDRAQPGEPPRFSAAELVVYET